MNLPAVITGYRQLHPELAAKTDCTVIKALVAGLAAKRSPRPRRRSQVPVSLATRAKQAATTGLADKRRRSAKEKCSKEKI